jgi:hypothetical protein
MKRVAAILTGATVLVMTQVGSAFAAGNDYPKPPSHSPAVGGTAFTGAGSASHVAVWFAVLLVLGVTALVVARRRTAHGSVTAG